MPQIGSLAAIAEVERKLDQANRFADMAVQFRILDEDGKPGRMWPRVYGGRWDTWLHEWVTPQPIDLDVVTWTIQEQQIPLLELGEDVKFVALFGGRQAGKSDIALKDTGLDAARSPGAQSIIVSKNYKMARQSWKALKALIPARWLKGKPNKEEGVWTLRNDHEILFRSEEAIDSCRGPSVKRLVLDEGALFASESYVTAVGTGTAQKRFRVLIPTTPKRTCPWIRQIDHEWQEKDEDGKAVRPYATVLRLKSEENPLADRTFLAQLKADLPPDLYAQEFEGKLVAPQHAVWYLVEPAVHFRPPGDLPEPERFWSTEEYKDADGKKRRRPRPPVNYTREFCRDKFGVSADKILSWDFGKEAVTAWEVYRSTRTVTGADGKVRTETRDYAWCVDELVDERTTTDHHAHKAAQRWGTNCLVITDAMGAHDKSEGRAVSPAGIKLLREAGFIKVIPVAERNPDIDNTIRAGLRLLRNADGDVRLFVHHRACPKLADAVENQERDKDGKVKNDGREHVADTLRYFVHRTFPIRTDLPTGWMPATRASGG